MDAFMTWLTAAPLGVVAVVLFIVLSLARELGILVQRLVSARADDPDGDSSDEGFILSAALGLLALLLAFTFGLSLNRYEARRELVVAESNAIGTAYMRTQVLEAPDRERLSGLLAQYARTRLAFGKADEAGKPALLASSRAQRGVLETATQDAVRPIRTTALGASMLAAVNDVVDLGAEREATLAARLPGSVLAVLLAFTIVSAAIVGYVLAGAGSRHRLATSVLFVLLAMSIWIILDLDKPRSGTILVSQDPMADLVKGLPSGPMGRPPGSP